MPTLEILVIVMAGVGTIIALGSASLALLEARGYHIFKASGPSSSRRSAEANTVELPEAKGETIEGPKPTLTAAYNLIWRNRNMLQANERLLGTLKGAEIERLYYGVQQFLSTQRDFESKAASHRPTDLSNSRTGVTRAFSRLRKEVSDGVELTRRTLILGDSVVRSCQEESERSVRVEMEGVEDNIVVDANLNVYASARKDMFEEGLDISQEETSHYLNRTGVIHL